MATTAKPSLPIVTITRFEVDPGHIIDTRGFLRGLRRPGSRALSVRAAREALIEALDPQGKSVVDVAPDASSKGSEARELCPEKKSNETKFSGDSTDMMETTKVTRTYTKKFSLNLRSPSPLFVSQGPVMEDDQTNQQAYGGQSPQRLETTVAATSNRRALKKDRAKLQAKPKRQGLQRSRKQTIGTASGLDPDNMADGIKSATVGKKKSRKRRLPVHGLALVHSLPEDSHLSQNFMITPVDNTTHTTSRERRPIDVLDELDRALLGEIDDPAECTPANTGRQKPPKEANIGKSVTRLRKEISIPKCHGIAHAGFRFPPTTPQSRRHPGWKLGSGFEGIDLGLGHRPNLQRAKHARFQTPTSRPLELSTALSPDLQTAKFRPGQNSHPMSLVSTDHTGLSEDVVGPDEARIKNGHEAGSSQICDLDSLLCPPKTSHHLLPASNPPKFECPASDAHDAEGSKLTMDNLARPQDIREPSNSERNGWLKRRRKVSFADGIDTELQRHGQNLRNEDEGDGIGSIFDAYNSKWHREKRVTPDSSCSWQPPHSNFQSLRLCTKGCGSEKDGIDDATNAKVNVEEAQDSIPDDPPPSCQRRPFPTQTQDSHEIQISPITSTTRQSIRVPSSHFRVTKPSRSLEVGDSQERRIDASTTSRRNPALQSEKHDKMPVHQNFSSPYALLHHPIPETSLGVGKYFSKAVEQLSSPIKKPLPTKGPQIYRQEEDFVVPDSYEDSKSPVGLRDEQRTHRIHVLPAREGLKRSRTDLGDLELGVTPILKRSMSSLPFRPPFKKF